MVTTALVIGWQASQAGHTAGFAAACFVLGCILSIAISVYGAVGMLYRRADANPRCCACSSAAALAIMGDEVGFWASLSLAALAPLACLLQHYACGSEPSAVAPGGEGGGGNGHSVSGKPALDDWAAAIAYPQTKRAAPCNRTSGSSERRAAAPPPRATSAAGSQRASPTPASRQPSCMDVEAIFESLDADGSGSITFDELMRVMRREHPGAASQALAVSAIALFAALDRNGDGKLSRDEVRRGLAAAVRSQPAISDVLPPLSPQAPPSVRLPPTPSFPPMPLPSAQTAPPPPADEWDEEPSHRPDERYVDYERQQLQQPEEENGEKEEEHMKEKEEEPPPPPLAPPAPVMGGEAYVYAGDAVAGRGCSCDVQYGSWHSLRHGDYESVASAEAGAQAVDVTPEFVSASHREEAWGPRATRTPWSAPPPASTPSSHSRGGSSSPRGSGKSTRRPASPRGGNGNGASVAALHYATQRSKAPPSSIGRAPMPAMHPLSTPSCGGAPGSARNGVGAQSQQSADAYFADLIAEQSGMGGAPRHVIIFRNQKRSHGNAPVKPPLPREIYFYLRTRSSSLRFPFPPSVDERAVLHVARPLESADGINGAPTDPEPRAVVSLDSASVVGYEGRGPPPSSLFVTVPSGWSHRQGMHVNREIEPIELFVNLNEPSCGTAHRGERTARPQPFRTVVHLKTRVPMPAPAPATERRGLTRGGRSSR